MNGNCAGAFCGRLCDVAKHRHTCSLKSPPPPFVIIIRSYQCDCCRFLYHNSVTIPKLLNVVILYWVRIHYITYIGLYLDLPPPRRHHLIHPLSDGNSPRVVLFGQTWKAVTQNMRSSCLKCVFRRHDIIYKVKRRAAVIKIIII